MSGLFSSLRTDYPASAIVLATVGTIAAASTIWVVSDYHQWVAFGSGGTPPTPAGYWKMTKFRWRHFREGHDLRDASMLSGEGKRYLRRPLPQRQGARPSIVARTMPQRQEPRPLDAAVRDRLHGLAAEYCARHPHLLYLDKSATEGLSADAIYAKPGLPRRDPAAADRILKDEVAHVHPSENSLHVWLSQPDARAVVEAGWGERFPLGAFGMCHPGWSFVYAPRSMEEVDVIEDIVRAAIAHLTGETV